MKGAGKLANWVPILFIFLVVWLVHYRIHHKYQLKESGFSQLLYLPSGKYLKPASFGYHALLADFIYLWSIQYYGDPLFHPRMEYLKHTYEIITELDPQFMDAYQTGAFLMIYDGRVPEAGLDLLDLGLERNPKEWVLPTDAGFYCMMNLKDRARAIQYFEKADAIPGAPSLVKRILASLHFKLGDTLLAYQLWKEVYETAERSSIKQTAFQHLHDLKVLIDLSAIRNAIESFREKQHQYPLNLEQLTSARLLDEIPLDPEGNEYQYNSRTGEVVYGQQLTIYKRYQ